MNRKPDADSKEMCGCREESTFSAMFSEILQVVYFVRSVVNKRKMWIFISPPKRKPRHSPKGKNEKQLSVRIYSEKCQR